MTLCIFCNTEHPPDQTANPHFCIARLQESNEALHERIGKLESLVRVTKNRYRQLDDQVMNLQEENAKLRAELERSTNGLISIDPLIYGGHTIETDGSVTVHPPEKRDPKWNPDKYRLTKSPEDDDGA